MLSKKLRRDFHPAMLTVFSVVLQHNVGSFYEIKKEFIRTTLSHVWIGARRERKGSGGMKGQVFQ